MFLKNWLKKILPFARCSTRPIQTPRPRHARLHIEQLENRWVPSSITALAGFDGVINPQHVALHPSGLVMDRRGDLFGTTARGGVNDLGIVFEMVAGSHTITTLASFNATNGANPH